MICYLDSSVLLRILFNEPSQLKSFSEIKHAMSAALFRVECLRTLDRARNARRIEESAFVHNVGLFYRFEETMELIPLTNEILARAAQPFSIDLGTLDAIHLATAILCRERLSQRIVFCTHDKALGAAAKTVGFEVLE